MVAGLLVAVSAVLFAVGHPLLASVASSAVERGAFDDTSPSVANLDPALLDALRRATSAAAGDGVALVVNSGWRSAAEQQRLLEQAISRYGSVEAASRWVA
ncbi:D-alanyl-D-alanine carboxypeptidase family protein, partial [Helicobacter bizzozeronii]|uniref:D-alanyl-D-alanine carboxypeptidase family protein n=1 Tax=Helicobacter bizzozeronii TaxID=56877 RepID=UPI002554DE1A